MSLNAVLLLCMMLCTVCISMLLIINILSYIGYPRLRLAEALICRDEIYHGRNVLLISVQVSIGSYTDVSRSLQGE